MVTVQVLEWNQVPMVELESDRVLSVELKKLMKWQQESDLVLAKEQVDLVVAPKE